MDDLLNSNDYKILNSIVDREHNRGLAKGRGSTINQIVEKTKLSDVKVRQTIKLLLKENLITEGVKKVRAKTFCITKEGIATLAELKKNII